MPRKPNPKTPEARVLTAAIAASGTNQAGIAEALEVSPGFISQFASGHRPVPWDKAEVLAELVAVSPEEISTEFRRMLRHFGASQVERLTPEIITAALTAFRKITGSVEGEVIDVEDDPELFAQSLRLALAQDLALRTRGANDGVGAGDGATGRTGGVASPAKAGAKNAPASRRARKPAERTAKRPRAKRARSAN